MTTTPHADLLTDDIRELQKWLNEDPNRPLDRPALSRVCAALLARLGEQQPVAWMWQHDETGRIGFVDPWQVANGWQAANPRCTLVSSVVYARPPAAQPVAQGEREAEHLVLTRRFDEAVAMLSLILANTKLGALEEPTARVLSRCRGNQAARSAAQGAAQVPAKRDGPGTPIWRWNWLVDELAKRFPEADQPYSAAPCEPRFLAAIDALLSAAPSPAGERASTEGGA